jgi:hypothetical protein
VCLVLYIGAADPLPLIAWDAAAPAFHVTPLDLHCSAVRQQFSVPHVYYAGSHAGCGCGFQLGEYVDWAEDKDAPAKRDSLRRLADYVEAQIVRGNGVEFFACWSGDEASPPEHRRVLSVGELRGEFFYFLEKEASTFALA